MRPSIYFTVHDWMVKKHGLKGTSLLVFALIYNYYSRLRAKTTKKDVMKYFGISDRGVRHRLKYLVDRGLVIKKEIVQENGCKYVYSPNMELINKSFLENE